MYTITFNRATIDDLINHQDDGRQVYGAIIIPYSGIFTNQEMGSNIDVPRILCPYQINDIIAIQEQWARTHDSYVYKTGNASTDAGYDFRPASTMPDAAVRMYARIVSIVPWRVTQDIIDNYLSIGVSADGYAGTAKIIGYKDNGNRILAPLRKSHNNAILNKSSQPIVTSNVSKKIVRVYYYFREKYTPSRSGPHIGSQNPPNNGPTISQAVAYSDAKIKDDDEDTSRTLIDSNNIAWSTIDIKGPIVSEYQGIPLICVGLSIYSPRPTVDPDDPDHPIPVPDEDKIYTYVRVNPETNKLIPMYAYYRTEVIDPSKHIFAWLFSAYLCDKEGNIIGEWF